MGKNFRGLTKKQEVAPGSTWRDTRTYGQRFGELLESGEGFLMIMAMIMVSAFVLPYLGEVIFLAGGGLIYVAKQRKFELPFRIPKASGLVDPADPKPGTDSTPGNAAGIAYFGTEINSRKEMWFKNDDMRTHILVFGSTGAGKTETLVSLAFNALAQGSGFIYVDGKGDSSLFAKVFSMAKSMGREDDVLVINYMTGSRDVFGPQVSKLSNTMNPFISGSSGALTELLVSLMDESGGDNAMWKGRAISLISAIMMALVDMRDRKEILLDVEKIRDHLTLEEIIKLNKRKDLPVHVLVSLNAYLKSLPGYQPNAAKQSETVMDQHGYLQMQFTKILGSLADSYGYIFKTNLGEVDFWDVVVNRRILVVLLPALEKSPEELANLGKIVVACLKQMMATGLGSSLEGEYKKIIETKPTNAPTPFMCILDEYGYYAVKGAAVMPAQARSLGFSMIFAGQDLPAFEKASKEEAASTVANCNIKIFMKLEDPKDTFELFQKSVGEAVATKTSGFTANIGAIVTNYTDMQNASLERQSRGDLLDLKDQREGEAHIIFKSSVVRGQMFYANPKMSKKLQLNYFLRVEPPEKDEILGLDRGIEELKVKLLNENFMRDIADSTEEVPDIDMVKEAFDTHAHLGLMEKGCVAVAVHEKLLASQLDIFRSQMGALGGDDDEERRFDVFNGDDEDEDFDEDDFDHPDTDEDFPVFLDESRTRRGLKEVEELAGESPDAAERNANRIIEDMKAVSQYPHGDVPEDMDPDNLLAMLEELDGKIEDDER